jgi:hypothetical protein
MTIREALRELKTWPENPHGKEKIEDLPPARHRILEVE